MTDVTNQRRMAAKILKCGINRVYMVPDREKLGEISEATTRGQVRQLITRGYIRKLKEKGVSRGRARAFHQQRVEGRRRGPGSRRGKAGARTNPKTRWISNQRAMRRVLRSLRNTGKLTTIQYRAYYRMAKGGQFHGRGHMLQQMEARGDLKPLPGLKRAAVAAKEPVTRAKAPAKPKEKDAKKGPAAKGQEPRAEKRGLLRRGKKGDE